MSLLCKFSYRGISFLIDPNLVYKVVEDTLDDTCELFIKGEHSRWVDGDLEEVQTILNAGRTLS